MFIPPNLLKVATCTPVDFEASARFFSRDTGLLCRGFQAAGVDCVVVMPGTRKADDAPDLIRCTPQELVSVVWWKTQNLDLVILYAWGDPKYLAVAKAIRNSGTRLVQSMDTAGLPSPYAHLETWIETTLAEIAVPQILDQRVKRLGRVIRDLIPYLFERRRLTMMNECDILAAVSPPAESSIKSYVEGLGRPEISGKLIVIPHSVAAEMIYCGENKQNHLLVVGRWGSEDSPQKDPQMTVEVVAEFLMSHPDWTAEIIGPKANSLSSLTSKFDEFLGNRLNLCNFIPHADLRTKYATSRILLCASRYESFHIASAEAICCGCSVVVARHPLLASTAWFATRNSGTLAKYRTVASLSEALQGEVMAWGEGRRDAMRISMEWSEVLHAHQVAFGILTSINLKSGIPTVAPS